MHTDVAIESTFRQQCSPPPSLPPTLSVFVTPRSPVIATNTTDITLACNVETPQGMGPDAYNFTYSWELDGSVLLCSNGGLCSSRVHRFSMGVQTEGVYRCIVSLENRDYPIVEVSTGVMVKLPRKHLGWGRGGGEALRGSGRP